MCQLGTLGIPRSNKCIVVEVYLGIPTNNKCIAVAVYVVLFYVRVWCCFYKLHNIKFDGGRVKLPYTNCGHSRPDPKRSKLVLVLLDASFS